MSTPAILNESSFIVMLDNQLTSYDIDVLDRLYLPIVGEMPISILKSFYEYVNPGEKESRFFSISSALKAYNINKMEFTSAIEKLEAVGLVSCYYKNDTFVFVLKRVLNSSEFFKDDGFVFLLIERLGKQEVDNLSYDFLLRRIDISSYEDITKKFDEVFDVVEEDNNLNCAGVDTYSNGITISKKQFNLDVFMVLMDSIDVVEKRVYKSNEFVNIIVKYAYLYGLSPEVLKDCVVGAAKTDKTVDMESLKVLVKKAYDNKASKRKVVYRKKVVTSKDPLVKMMDSSTPNDVVKAKYKVPLLSGEIAMFDDILTKTGISIGVLNTLIIYVMDTLNGQIPNKQYFLKVLNTWIRQGVDTTEKALNLINGNTPKQVKPRYNNKPKTNVPEWFKEQEQEQSKDIDKQEDSSNDEECDKSLQDLIDFFNK